MNLPRHIHTAVVLSALVAGCAQANFASREPVSREKVVENLNPIVDMEKRGLQLTLALQDLPLAVDVAPEDARVLKEAYDVYYVYLNVA